MPVKPLSGPIWCAMGPLGTILLTKPAARMASPMRGSTARKRSTDSDTPCFTTCGLRRMENSARASAIRKRTMVETSR